MRKIISQGQSTIVLIDLITEIQPDDSGRLVISGSLAGVSVVEYVLHCAPAAVFFNDAGVGKDGAGIAALTLLNQKGIAAGAVAHTSARIGDAADSYESGILSYLNDIAMDKGLVVGEKLLSQCNARQ